MKGKKNVMIDVLCRFGKFGVGKSLTFGMYDFEAPEELMTDVSEARNEKVLKKLEGGKIKEKK